MPKFPVDAPKGRVIRAFESLGFRLIRQREHVVMARENIGGGRNVLVLPNHLRIKGPTLRDACTEARVGRAEFLKAYEEA